MARCLNQVPSSNIAAANKAVESILSGGSVPDGGCQARTQQLYYTRGSHE